MKNVILIVGHRYCIQEVQNYIKEKGLKYFADNYKVSDCLSCNERKRKESTTITTHNQNVRQNATETEQNELLNQEKILHEIIKKWYLSIEDGKTIFGSFFKSSRHDYVNVYLQENRAGGLAAKLKCCICGIVIPAGMYEYRKGRVRWVYRNFTNHAKSHLPKINRVKATAVSSEKTAQTAVTKRTVQPLITDALLRKNETAATAETEFKSNFDPSTNECDSDSDYEYEHKAKKINIIQDIPTLRQTSSEHSHDGISFSELVSTPSCSQAHTSKKRFTRRITDTSDSDLVTEENSGEDPLETN